jgi:hypothetical protein
MRADLGAERATPAEEAPAERVHERIDDDAHEAVAFGGGQGTDLRQLGVVKGDQVAQLDRRIHLFGDAEEPPLARQVAEADPAGHDRHGDRQQQRADDRRRPPEVVGVEPERAAPGAREERVGGVMAEGFTPRRLGIVAPLRLPADRAAEQAREHVAL